MATTFCGPGTTCRVWGCTDEDCYGCYERTGEPCYWVEADLCSACQETAGPYRRRPSGIYVLASFG